MFSACEYVIAVANILFHYTAVSEFGKASWCLLECSMPDRHPATGCDKDCSIASNRPILNHHMVSVKDYDNNDRKKFS